MISPSPPVGRPFASLPPRSADLSRHCLRTARGRNLIGFGGSVRGSLLEEVESVVWWGMSALPRKRGGRHHLVPLHSDIQVRTRRLGFDCLQPILWNKIANGVTESEGNGAGFYGKPYQPGGIIKNDVEYILFLRKGGEYRTALPIQKALSMLTKEEMKAWFRSIWSDLRGASTRDGHPAPYPVELAERLIKMFSFAGDTVLDPFAGTGSTSQAAILSGRNSIANEIEAAYVEIAHQRITRAVCQQRFVGATEAEVIVDKYGHIARIPAPEGIPAAV